MNTPHDTVQLVFEGSPWTVDSWYNESCLSQAPSIIITGNDSGAWRYTTDYTLIFNVLSVLMSHHCVLVRYCINHASPNLAIFLHVMEHMNTNISIGSSPPFSLPALEMPWKNN